MAGHRFRGADGNLLGAIAEEALDGGSFEAIAERSGSSVRVEIADSGGIQLGVFQSSAHDAERAVAIFGGLRDMKCIAGHAVADDLSEDRGIALLRVLERFKNKNSGAFADDESVAVRVERAA